MRGTLPPGPADGWPSAAADVRRCELGQPNTLLAPVAKLVKTKKRCCKSGPRCKQCPVVCKRLEKQGLAERLELRVYQVSANGLQEAAEGSRAR